MTPNVADFIVFTDNQAGNEIQCPECYECFIPKNAGQTIRDLIATASVHARSAHAMSAPAAIKGG